MTEPITELDATRADATRRLTELRRVRAVLWPDRTDERVYAELLDIQSEIRCAEAAIASQRALEATR